MLSCDEIQDYIVPYAKGYYSRIPDIEGLKEHLASCDSCWKAFRSEEKFIESASIFQLSEEETDEMFDSLIDNIEGLRGILQDDQGRYLVDALESYDKVYELRDKALGLISEGKFSGAAECINEAERIHGSYGLMFAFKNYFYNDMRKRAIHYMHDYPADHAKAITYLEPMFIIETKNREAGHFDTMVWLASAYQRVQRYEDSKRMLDLIHEYDMLDYLDTHNLKRYFAVLCHILGRIHRLDFNEDKRAYICLEKSFEIDPSYMWGAMNLAWYYFCDKEYGKSLIVVNKLFSLDIDRDDLEYAADYIHDMWREALNKKWYEAYPRIIGMLELAHSKFPADDFIMYELMLMHTKSGQYDQALGYLDKFENFNYKDFHTFFLAAEIYCAKRNKKKAYEYAKKTIDEALDRKPDVERDIRRLFETTGIDDVDEKAEGFDDYILTDKKIPNYMIPKLDPSRDNYAEIDEHGKQIFECKLN
jgi:tetratricopeptide (TPR) repeat protein